MRKSARTLALILAAVMIIAMFPITASAATYKPGKVKITTFSVSKVSKTKNTATVTIKWRKASRATGYRVYEYNRATGKWKLLKKLGKNYVGIKIYKVYAGSRKFKVCAVRKVGKKIYKGPAVIKSKFITSPMTLEKVYKLEGEETEFSDDTMAVSVKGNKINIKTTVTARPDDAAIQNYFTSMKSSVKSICKSARLNAGVKGTSGVVSLYLGSELLDSKTYTEYSK
jgi:hypothetical protein